MKVNFLCGLARNYKKMSKQQWVIFSRKHKGSILAYSLIILAMMLAIATSISVATINEKKAASGTEFSMQSLQTADSGVQITLKKLISSSGTIASVFGPSCVDSAGIGKVTAAGPAGSNYEITFLNTSNIPLSCGTNISSIDSIKSIGTYHETARAVSVKVAMAAATGDYQISCAPISSNSGNNSTNTISCCRIRTSDGAVSCRQMDNSSWTWGSWSSWS